LIKFTFEVNQPGKTTHNNFKTRQSGYVWFPGKLEALPALTPGQSRFLSSRQKERPIL
jgi:hypothetical protein